MKVVEYGKPASSKLSVVNPPSANGNTPFDVPDTAVVQSGSGKGKLSREASFNWDFYEGPNGGGGTDVRPTVDSAVSAEPSGLVANNENASRHRYM